MNTQQNPETATGTEVGGKKFTVEFSNELSRLPQEGGEALVAQSKNAASIAERCLQEGKISNGGNYSLRSLGIAEGPGFELWASFYIWRSYGSSKGREENILVLGATNTRRAGWSYDQGGFGCNNCCGFGCWECNFSGGY